MNLGGSIAVAGIAALLLSACQDDSAKRAAKGADTVRGNSIQGPPNTDWRLMDSRAVEANVYMDVRVDPGTAVAMKAVPRMLSSQISQYACPTASDKVWKILDEEQEVWINLIDHEMKSIVKSRCKRP